MYELRQRDFSWGALRTGTCGRGDAHVATPCADVSLMTGPVPEPVTLTRPNRRRDDEICVGCATDTNAVAAGLEQYAALLAAVRRRWRQATRHGSQPPFFYVCLDEDEAALAEIDVHGARPIGAHCWEEVLRFQAMNYVVKLFAIASEEDAACAWAISNTNHVALDKFWAVVGALKRLVISTLAGRNVGKRTFVPTCNQTPKSDIFALFSRLDYVGENTW